MLDVKIKDLLNQQINKEFYSAYLYLAFSNYFSERNLSGFSNWYRIQAQEERDHAMLFLQYLENNSETVVLEAVDRPEQDFQGDMAVLEKGLQHERYVTDLIHTCLLYTSTMKSRPRSTSISAKWKKFAARNLRTRRTRCWFPSVPAPVLPCLA